MPPASDCCCICFTLRQGVILIGIITWINSIAMMYQLINFEKIWWYFLPGTILSFATGIKFLAVNSAYK